jgi:hypothetical protein
MYIPVKNSTEKAVLRPIDPEMLKGNRPSPARMLATAAFIHAQDTLDILKCVMNGDIYGCQELMGDNPNAMYWGISFRDSFLGWVGYRYHTDPEGQREAHPGGVTMLFDDLYHGMGIGSAASLARVFYAFEEEKIERLRMVVDSNNERSIASVRKLGGICLADTFDTDENAKGYGRHHMVVYNPAAPVEDFHTLAVACESFAEQGKEQSLERTRAKIEECRAWGLS